MPRASPPVGRGERPRAPAHVHRPARGAHASAAIAPPPAVASGGGEAERPVRYGISSKCVWMDASHASAGSRSAPTRSKGPCVIPMAAGRLPPPNRSSAASRMGCVHTGTDPAAVTAPIDRGTFNGRM